MECSAQLEIRGHVHRFLVGQMSANDLRLWVMPKLWSIRRATEPTAFHAASRIALYLAEYGAGHRTLGELRGLLGPFLLPPIELPSATTSLIVSDPALDQWSAIHCATPARALLMSGSAVTFEPRELSRVA
jgi:hypothetical protein